MKRLALVLLLTTLPSTAVAQHSLALAPSRSTLFEVDTPSLPGPEAIAPAAYPRTHWKEGAIAGGIVVGLLGAGLAEGLCHAGEGSASCTGSFFLGGLAGGLLGMTIGALIGGQFPK